MLKKIFIGIGIVVLGVFIYAAVQPPQMHVEREILISAPPEVLFPFINNAQKSYEWMPWSDGDPGLEIQFIGPAEGVGAISNWKGKDMGVGQSEVVESVQNEFVKTRLNYTEPFKMSQIATMNLKTSEGGTLVKWSVEGHNNFFFRLVGVFVNCDKMIGSEFEKGLKKLKSLAENK
jgi:uncharacterized protein YndB with AHSA1/START domain